MSAAEEEPVLSDPDEDASLQYQLGLSLWEQGDKERAAEHFLASAKLNPNNADPFKYLGHYYAPQDPHRSLKCYQRAVSLNPDDSDAGDSLCDLLPQDSLQLALCTDSSRKSPRAFWAFRRMGFLHLHRSSYSQAVQCLQQAIRGYPTSPQLWEALGLSYHRLGMFTAASKSYSRAIELDGTSVLALIESGNIFLMLGSFRKGVEQFQQALKIAPQNVSANYGLASALLGWSKECMNLGAFRWGATLLKEAQEIVYTATCSAGNVLCLWKLHGDIQLACAKCFPWMKEDQSSESDAGSFRASILSWRNTCYLAAMSARRSYQRALHLAPWEANLYMDVAVTADLLLSMNEEDHKYIIIPWQLSEKMALGALLLEGANNEFWVTLGCISDHNVLKQHALIRGLQLDLSLAIAWCSLGMLYREDGEKKLARQAFDCARSVDPSLALPWAGMSADFNAKESTGDEAFESCLRAVQILPLAEFQIGLAKLALASEHLASSQVYGAIQQAIQRAPHYPESHNLNGLICEARKEYPAAIASYRLAHCAVTAVKTSGDSPKSHLQDVAINLARCLSRAGYATDAVQECEHLKKAGLLDEDGLQIYAFSLWQLGKNDSALSVTRNLIDAVRTMEMKDAAASVSLVSRLLYCISGVDVAITMILQMPEELFHTFKVAILVCAIHALDKSDRLDSAASSIYLSFSSHDERIELHYLTALAKLLKYGSTSCLEFQTGIRHLKKALHIYPGSSLIRNLLAYLIICSEEWSGAHLAGRCCSIDAPYHSSKGGLRSGYEIAGAATFSCHAIGNKHPMFSFPTCSCQCLNGSVSVVELQRYLHQEPWNSEARYLLIINLVQKAREERFPRQLCVVLERLLSVALSDGYSRESAFHQYKKFQLLLCASEISLQIGDILGSTLHANNAIEVVVPDKYLFFGHLLLCRAYAAQDDYLSLHREFLRCLDLKTDYQIGWICLKILEVQYQVQCDLNVPEIMFKNCSKELTNSWNMWMAVFNLVLGLISLRNQELLSAEESFAQACSLTGAESCVSLCHGATCIALAKQFHKSQFLTLAEKSLTAAQAKSGFPLPIVSLLLAQAEGSLGSKEKWVNNLRLEWYSWPQEMRAAELFFQMHLLAKESKAVNDPSLYVEFCQSPTKWVLRAIHTNPSCFRYWKVLQKLVD